MKIRWTQGVEQQRSLDIKSKYKESKLIRTRIFEMLQDMIEEKRAGAVSESKYDNPNWAYLQADRVGYERALRDVMELITDKD